MAVRRFFALTLFALLFVVGCTATSRAPLPSVIALLAPFEGRYREIGYDALYGLRLGLQESEFTNVTLLPLDDGGSVTSAKQRAHAIRLNPQIKAVVVVGLHATAPEVITALDGLPILVMGEWGITFTAPNLFILSNADIAQAINTPARADILAIAPQEMPVIGSEMVSLRQLAKLRQSLYRVTTLSSASLPDEDFRARYATLGEFVPPASLFSTLAYDSAQVLASALQNAPTRADAINAMTNITHEGYNGQIRFANGYWESAPLNRYIYNDAGEIIPQKTSPNQ